MKCLIPGANVKVFARAIHSLHKIGDELYIEALENGLALRTVNSSRSAFTSFIFAQSFFISYLQLDGTADQSEALKCKISLKSCVSVFKSLTTLEKTVEKCKISLLLDEDRLIFQLYCHHGIVKTHRLRFMECDSLQAVYSKELCPNVIVCQTKLLSDAVLNFQQGQEEITLIATPVKFTIKSHVDEHDPDAAKAVRTELCLNPVEFESYTVGVDAEITFCLKELKAALFFSEASNLPITLHFESAGKPVVFAISGDATFEANLVLATLVCDVMAASQVTASSQAEVRSTSGVQQAAIKRPTTSHSRNLNVASSKPTPVSQIHSRSNIERSVADDETAMETFDIQQDVSALATTAVVNGNNSEPRGLLSTSVIASHLNEEDDALLVRSADAAVLSSQRQLDSTASRERRTVVGEPPKSRGLFSLVGIEDSPAERRDKQSDDSDDPAEVEDNAIPGTPPSKRFKSLFFGLSQSTSAGSQAAPSRPNVLVEDSDED